MFEEFFLLYCITAREQGFTNYSRLVDTSTLQELSWKLPVTPDEMISITGIGQSRYSKFGHRLLDVTMKYAAMLASECT